MSEVIKDTVAPTERLVIILKSRSVPFKGQWYLSEEDSDEHFDFAAQPVSYNYLVAINDDNYIIHPDDIAFLTDVMGAIQPFHYVHIAARVIAPSGAMKHLHGHGTLEANKDISIKALQADAQDYCQRSFSTGSFAWDVTNNTLSVSDEVHRIHGLRREDKVTWKSLFAFIHPNDYASAVTAYGKMIEDREAFSTQYRIIRKDGLLRYVEVGCELFSVDEGKHQYFLGFIRDITEQKNADRRIYREYERFREAEAIGHTGSFEWVVLTGALFWSDEMYHIHGLAPRSEVVGLKGVIELTHPEDMQLLAEKINEAHTTPGKYEVLHRIIRRDGETRYVSKHYRSFADETGRVVRVAGTCKDVTDEMRANFILNSLNEVLMELDKDFNIRFANVVASRVWDRDPEEILNRNIWEVFPEIKESPIYSLLNEAFHTKQNVKGEVFCPVINRWIYLNATPSPSGLIISHFDVTDQVESRHRIKRHEQLLRETEVIGNIGSYEGNVGALNFHFSDGLFRLLGYAPGAFEPSLDFLDSISHPDDREPIRKIIADAIEHKQPYIYQRRIYLPSGEMRYMESKGKVFLDDAGNAAKIIGISRDVTEQRRAEEEIRSSKNLLQSIFETSLQAISVLKAVRDAHQQIIDFEWLFVNPVMTKIFAKDKDLIGKKFSEAFPELEQSVLYSSMLSVVDHQKREDLEWQFEVEGRLYWLRSIIVKLDDSVVVTTEDITERKRAEQEIVDRKELLEAMFHTLPHAFMIADVIRDEQQNIIDFECQWTNNETKAFPPTVSIGQRLLRLHPKLREIGLLDEMVRTVSLNTITQLEYLYEWKGTQRWFRTIAVKIGDKLFTISEDISDRKKSQESMETLNRSLFEKNVTLKSMNEELANFAFIASHDLREPLRKIKMFSNMLMEKEMKTMSAQAKEYCQKIWNAVNRMNALIDDILTISQVGTSTGRTTSVNLQEILNTILVDLRDTILEKQAIVEAEKLPEINGNTIQLTQLVQNLLSNALKFQSPGRAPHVVILARQVRGADITHPQAQKDKLYFRLSVGDNGIGFESQYSEKIFQMFQRLQPKTDFPGTGIGLAICKKVMENHNGFIVATSRPNEGSVFHCYFPLN